MTVLTDGHEALVVTTAPTVAAMLSVAHIAVGAQDVVAPTAASHPVTGMVVRVDHVRGARVVTLETVPRTVVHVNDAALSRGTDRVTTTGHAGEARVTYLVRYVGATSVTRTVVSRVAVRAMQPEVVHVGTRAATVPRSPVAVHAPSASSGGLNWAALAGCESGGNPRSVGGGGRYFGLYQFSLATWAGVGGQGNPIDASASEQTYRAELLYARGGRGQWPTCGRLL